MLFDIDFMNPTHAFIYFRSKTLSVCDHLLVEHLLPSKTPTNVIKTTSSFSIARLAEAIIPVASNIACDGSFLIEPLPFFHNKHVSLAHAVVSVNKKKTQCIILNPTNASVLLRKHTVLATISPIQNHDVFRYEKSTTEPSVLLVSYDTQLQALNELDIEVDANHYNQLL